jgi:hypothetical protein
VTFTDDEFRDPTTNVPLSSLTAALEDVANATEEEPADWAWNAKVAMSAVPVMSGCDGVISTIEAVPAVLFIKAARKTVPKALDLSILLS